MPRRKITKPWQELSRTLSKCRCLTVTKVLGLFERLQRCYIQDSEKSRESLEEEYPLSDPKHDESFKVVDRRLFTSEGELRKEVAEQQDREHDAAARAGAPQAARPAAAPAPGPTLVPDTPEAAPAPTAETPKRSAWFENLVRSLGQNAAMLLGGYADPRTGQPMLDLEGAREVIDMLDALREKTNGNLAPEEDTLLLEMLGNLKLAYMEMTKAATAAAMQEKAKNRQ